MTDLKQGSFEGGDWNQNFAKFRKRKWWICTDVPRFINELCHDVSRCLRAKKTKPQHKVGAQGQRGWSNESLLFIKQSHTPYAASSSSDLNFFRFHFKLLERSAVWSSKPFVLAARLRPYLRQHPHRFKGTHQTLCVLEFLCYLHALPTSKKMAFKCLLCVLHNQDHRCLTSRAWSQEFRTYIPLMDIESSLKQHASTMHSLNRLATPEVVQILWSALASLVVMWGTSLWKQTIWFKKW